MELNGAVDLDLSGIPVALRGTSREVEQGVRREWAAFVAGRPHPTPFLECEFGCGAGPAPGEPFEPKRMRSRFEPARAVFDMPQGRAEVAAGGRARIDLARGLGRQEYWTAMNLLRACLAWRLPDRDAALLHAAGLVVAGRGYLLVGAAGSGKSSWARIGEAAGAHVVSDDLVLCDAAGERVELLGAPFRSTHRADYRPGRWPLDAVLFPHHGSRAAWSPAAGLVARARILANLPFVSDAAGDARVERVVERLCTRAPCLDLSFALDPSFVDLLRAGPPAAGREA